MVGTKITSQYCLLVNQIIREVTIRNNNISVIDLFYLPTSALLIEAPATIITECQLVPTLP